MSGLRRVDPAVEGAGRWLIRFAGALARGGVGAVDGGLPRPPEARISRLFSGRFFAANPVLSRGKFRFGVKLEIFVFRDRCHAQEFRAGTSLPGSWSRLCAGR